MRSIDVVVRRSTDGALTLLYRIDGDIAGLLVPPAATARFVTGLWQHTCLEAFVAVDGQPSYHELNFAPSGEWAVFAFCRYRDGVSPGAEPVAPGIVLRAGADRIELEARMALDGLSSAYANGALRIGLSAVIEAIDGTLSYWALRHPGDSPDFHHPEAFALRLEPAREGC